MAYGLRLKIEYRDRNDILTAINIYQDGFTGVADVRTANQGIRIEWGDQGSEGMPVIYGSSCTIFFDAEFDYEFLYLFSEDAKKHRVDVEKNGNIFWTGFVEPGEWSEPLIAAPYPVECTAYDGLGFLKDTPFLDALGEYYTGKKTLFEILKICLLKTGLDLTIHCGIDWEEQEQIAGADFTKIHKVNCEAFKDMSCYDVLTNIFPECRIFQRSARWWVISNTNFYRYTIDYFTTNPDGSTAIDSLVSAADGWWIENQASMQMQKAVKHLVVVQDYGLNNNLLVNGSFDKFNAESGALENWTAVGLTPQQKALNDKGDKFIFLPGREYPYWQTQQAQYIKTILPVKASASVLKLGMQYAALGAEGKALAIYFRARLVGASGIYHRLIYSSNETDGQLDLMWTHDDPASPHPKYAMIPLRSHAVFSDYENKYIQVPDTVPTYPLSKITDHFETFSALVSGIPEDGTLEIFLYNAYTPYSEILGICYAEIKVELLDDTEEQYPESITHLVTNTENNNYVPEELTLKIGDYPDLPNSDIMFKGGLSRADNSHTYGWRQIGTIAYYSFTEFIALMRAAGQKKPRQSYDIRLDDIIPTLNMTIWDSNNSNKRLLENGISYDDRMQAIEGRYDELFPVDFTGLSLESAIKFDDKGAAIGKSTKSSFPSKAVNAEERVTLIDSAGAKVSAPGHLYNNDFEINEGQYDDGLIRLQIKRNAVTPYNLDQAAGQLQFSLTSVAEVNFGGNANQVRFSAGKFLIHNFNALDKDNRLTAIQL